MKKQLLNIDEVKAITGFSTTTIYKHVKQGTFPPPKNCGGRAVRWRLADIEAYIRSGNAEVVNNAELIEIPMSEYSKLKKDEARLNFLAQYRYAIHTHNFLNEYGLITADYIFSADNLIDFNTRKSRLVMKSDYRGNLRIGEIRREIDKEMCNYPKGRATLKELVFND